jgi:hypothetical protein
MVRLDLIFDTTDIEQGTFFLCAIEHDKQFTENLRFLFNLDEIKHSFESAPAWPIIDWFRSHP